MGKKNERLTTSIVRTVMNLYYEAEIKVRMGLKLSEKFQVQVGVNQRHMFSLPVFLIVVEVIMEYARRGLMTEIIYVDGLILMRKSMLNLIENFLK